MATAPSGNRRHLDEGWAALRAARWQDARAQFTRVIQVDACPEAFEGLSWAAWWLDDPQGLFGARLRAFDLYREHGDVASAARVATWLAADELDFHGALALASGWLDRARRLLEHLPESPEHGWFAFHEGFIESIKGNVRASEDRGALAGRIGRQFRVPDLEMLGLALQGRSLVSRARVREGMRCLDEASAIALSREALIPIASAWTCCFLVTACTDALDFERAFEWCDRIFEFAERYGSRYMLGFCRDEYATIFLWRGEWTAAEAALTESIEAFSVSRAPLVSAPLARLAELRRRQGQPEQAERLLDRAGASTQVQLCRANLALDSGDPLRAADLAERALRSMNDDRLLDKVPALDVVIPSLIACRRLEDARTAVETLTGIAEAAATTALRARADLAAALLAAATGEVDRAKPLLEDAIDGFDKCRARFEAARARIELGEILLALDRPGDARYEARAAYDCLRELGAVTDCERALGVVRRCEPIARPGTDPVSRREKEVLGLLAEGRTNREISERLGISEHTVHRHVANILRKLDTPSRAAAVACAIRIGLVQAPPE